MHLSQWMVQSGGTLFGVAKLRMLRDIVRALWPAVTAADPSDPAARPFVADAIIANPVSFGHMHVAEAMGVPLHMMFLQPCALCRATGSPPPAPRARACVMCHALACPSRPRAGAVLLRRNGRARSTGRRARRRPCVDSDGSGEISLP